MEPNLPIDLIPGTSPPRFRWRQVVDSPTGKRTVNCEGTLPPSVERAIEALVGITKQLMMDNVGLEGRLRGLEDRCTNQAAIIEKRTEASTTEAKPQTAGGKRGK